MLKVLGYFHIVRSADDTHLRFFFKATVGSKAFPQRNTERGAFSVQTLRVALRPSANKLLICCRLHWFL